MSSSLGIVSPQSDDSPTSEKTPFKFPYSVKIDTVEENMEPSHGEDGFTKFFFTISEIFSPYRGGKSMNKEETF